MEPINPYYISYTAPKSIPKHFNDVWEQYVGEAGGLTLEDKWFQYGNPCAEVSLYDSRELESLSKHLPGMQELVEFPCKHINVGKYSLGAVIMHLNDAEKWSREEIADWLDKLADDGIIDIEFKTPL